jgi:hypothetical protein
MKKLLLTIGLVAITAIGWGQVFENTYTVKDGMNRDVEVKVTIYQSGADFTLEEASRNRAKTLTEEHGVEYTPEQALSNAVTLSFAMTKIFVVKNKATWIPSELSMYWDEETSEYVGLVKGFAQNSYGMAGEITDLVHMGINGSISRVQ